MASGPEHDDEAPSLASRVLDLLDDDLLGLGDLPAKVAPETPPDAPALDDAQAPEASHPPPSDKLEPEPSPPKPAEVEPNDQPVASPPSETRRGRKFKPKGMFLGRRRDNDEPVDIKSTVLARHAAMLGSTGSGKTVMAKALIEEAALAGIPALIIDPQGDLARLALGGDASTIEAKGEDAARMRKLMESTEVRIWTPLRSKGLPLCIDPFTHHRRIWTPKRRLPHGTWWPPDSRAWPDTTSRRRRARRSNPTCTKCSSKARASAWT